MAAPLPGDSELARKCCLREGRAHFAHSPAPPFSQPTALSLSSSNPLILPSMLFSPVPPFPPYLPHTYHYLPPPLLPPLTFRPRFQCGTVENLSSFHGIIGYASAAIITSIVVSPHAPVVVLLLRLPLPLSIKRERVSFQMKQNMRSMKRNMRRESQMVKPRERKRRRKNDKQRRENMESNQKREAMPREAKHEK